MSVQTEVQFMPTPIYVKAFGKEQAKEQAKACRQETWMDRCECDSFDEDVSADDDEDPIARHNRDLVLDLKLAGVLLASGFLIGLCVGHILFSSS